MLINFKEFLEKEQLNESVINKIKDLFFINDANKVVREFKNIFNIKDEIKISKTSIGGHINPDTMEIKYNTIQTLIHELVHYLQLKTEKTLDYIPPKFNDEGLLKYMIQPLELNNISLSFSYEALKYNSFDDFINIFEKTDDFENATSQQRLKHMLYILKNNQTNKYVKKMFRKIEQYSIILKAIKNTKKYKVNEIVDFI